MIDFNHERDKRRFLKRNLEVAKQTELDEEKQRLAMGKIPEVRRPLIDKIYRPSFTPKR